MEVTEYSIVMENPDVFPQVVDHLWLRRDETKRRAGVDRERTTKCRG
jgi:hypothetical protein